MPTDAERRCRVYFAKPFRDCIDVCEVSPDLEERTDATMRVIAAAPDMLAAMKSYIETRLRGFDADPRDEDGAFEAMRRAVAKAEGRNP